MSTIVIDSDTLTGLESLDAGTAITNAINDANDSFPNSEGGGCFFCGSEPNNLETGSDYIAQTQMEFSSEGETLLKSIEELRLQPYDDQTGQDITSWVEGATIGYGHLIDEPDWSLYQNGITSTQADTLFNADIAPFVSTVNESFDVTVSQQEFDASVLLAFNIGADGFSNSSVVSLINDPNASTDYSSVEDAWKAWNKSQGEVNQGLINRRNAEWNIYSDGVYETW